MNIGIWSISNRGTALTGGYNDFRCDHGSYLQTKSGNSDWRQYHTTTAAMGGQMQQFHLGGDGGDGGDGNVSGCYYSLSRERWGGKKLPLIYY